MGYKSTISTTPADKSKSAHRGALFMQGIPQSTKNEFKAACARKEKSMRDVIITLMRQFVKESSQKN
jgi:hypothetical protein